MPLSISNIPLAYQVQPPSSKRQCRRDTTLCSGNEPTRKPFSARDQKHHVCQPPPPSSARTTFFQRVASCFAAVIVSASFLYTVRIILSSHFSRPNLSLYPSSHPINSSMACPCPALAVSTVSLPIWAVPHLV